MSEQKKKIVYFDMDGTLVDYEHNKNVKKFHDKAAELYCNIHNVPGFFKSMPPIEGAVEAFYRISLEYDCYIASTPPWSGPIAWMEKREWVERYLGDNGMKRLILTHRKDLLLGDYLIDDRTVNGVLDFKGKHIHFGSKQFPNWEIVTDYLLGSEDARN